MFSHVSLPDLESISKRTVYGSIGLGVVGLIITSVLGAAFGGLGFCAGLSLGILNFRMIQRSVIKVGERQVEKPRRPLAMNTVTRLFFISALALGLLFVNFELGFGIMAGLAAFQVLLLLNVTRLMVRQAGSVAGFKGALSGPLLDNLNDEEDDA
jgi:hypothetical protein